MVKAVEKVGEMWGICITDCRIQCVYNDYIKAIVEMREIIQESQFHEIMFA